MELVCSCMKKTWFWPGFGKLPGTFLQNNMDASPSPTPVCLCQIFRRAFEDGLELQRERVRELQRFAREKQRRVAKQHHEELESLEN